MLLCIVALATMLALFTHSTAQAQTAAAGDAATLTASAVPANPAAEADGLTGFVEPLVVKYPVLATVLMLIGILRAIFKPIVTYLENRAAATPDTADDEKIKAVEASGWYRALAWVLDFGASIKVGPQKK